MTNIYFKNYKSNIFIRYPVQRPLYFTWNMLYLPVKYLLKYG